MELPTDTRDASPDVTGEPEATDVPADEPVPAPDGAADLDSPAVPFLNHRAAPRWRVESILVRLIATSGIIGIGVALAAVLGTQSIQYWITGLVISTLSVVLAAMLWSSRTL